MSLDVHKEANSISYKLKSLSEVRRTPFKATPKSILRRFYVFVVCLPLVFLVGLMISAAIAGADTAGDIATRQSQAESVRGDIASLNSEMEIKVEIYNNANYQLSKIEASIEENQAKLDAASVMLGEMQDRLETRIVNIYRNGSVNMLDVLMETNDLDEFLTEFDMLTKVGEQDRDDLDQVKMLQEQVEQARTQLASDKATQSTLVDQLSIEKADIESGLAQRQQMLTGIEGEIGQLQAQAQEQEQAAQ